jgi:hypothetical protein
MLLMLATLISSCSTCKRGGPGDTFQDSQNPETGDIVQYRMIYTGTTNNDLIIDLIQGESTFVMEYNGNENFVVNLTTNEGKIIENLANVNGRWKGVKKFTVTATNPYLLQIRTNGPWSVAYY